MYITNAVNNTLLMAQLSSLGRQSAPPYVRTSHVSDIMQRGFAAVSLLLLAPLFLIISLLIKLTSQGPILCRGLRIGKDGRVFTIYEFCTLRAGAAEKSGARLLTDCDAYYTRIGKFLKCTKLDQLPQLVNVLKGEMNFVGPRPVRPLFLQQLGGDIPRFPVRLTVKPWIMGLAVGDDRYGIDLKSTRRDELSHINLRSLLLALNLIALKIVAIPQEFSSFFKGLLS
jgi:lipopolysaccharide/colanic/teichoic acid biosynthesis glycosyltransferase